MNAENIITHRNNMNPPIANSAKRRNKSEYFLIPILSMRLFVEIIARDLSFCNEYLLFYINVKINSMSSIKTQVSDDSVEDFINNVNSQRQNQREVVQRFLCNPSLLSGREAE